MKTKYLLLALTLAAVSVPATRADLLDINITGEIRLGRRPPPPPPPVVVIEESRDQGPSPWERGRWYQRQHAYYYYPGGDVYYRADDHMWFYLERGQWRSGRNLPERINIDFGRSITVTMATERPYVYHDQIVVRYPANYFGTRVRLRDDHDDHDRGNDRDKDNRGKGHDKHKDRDKDR